MHWRGRWNSISRGCGSAGEPRADARGEGPLRGGVVQQEDAQEENQVIEEGVVGGEDDSDLEGRNDAEADEAEAAREKEHPDQCQFREEREEGSGGVEGVREVLHVPADPGGQGAVLIIVVHRGEVAPGLIAARDFHDARFEINPEPFPTQKIKAGSRWRAYSAESGAQPRGCKEERDKSGFEKHAVGLEAGELLSDRDERKKTDEADEERKTRPKIQDDADRGDEADPAEDQQHAI